nr:olfactory receptor 14A16-like [Pelodiscus sinensis]|eukprot:XP_014435381.1 olfactory receptor 14A16-like [Pelodiscus sinensis]
MPNGTVVTEFLLQGFSDGWDQQILLFVLFLGLYLAALVGNLLILAAVAFNRRLHTPMYFFLGNLSLLDLCYVSVTVPKAMAGALTSSRRISFSACAAQVFLVVTCAVAELALLTVMAFDRYVAICHPLHYTMTMSRGACVRLAAGSWIGSAVCSALHTANTFRLPFCGSNVVAQFFCAIPQLLRLSCSETRANELVMIALGSLLDGFCFALIIASYGCIFSTVMRIPSEQGRYKVFSTCLPHLLVFGLFIGTASFTYMQPTSTSSPALDRLATVLYCLVPPLMNPIIYSLRNSEVKACLWTMLGGRLFPTKDSFLPRNP